MNFKQYYLTENDITQEMIDWFTERTNKHIKAVQKYAELLYNYDTEKFKDIIEIAKQHDQIKFQEPEYTPYIYISWNYHCKDLKIDYKIPNNIDDNAATVHHVKHSKHHPESWSGEIVAINKEDRDKPNDEIVDATKMPDLYVGEMVCDWRAMGDERGNSAKAWADKNVNIRWKFTDKQKELIYDIIKYFEENK